MSNIRKAVLSYEDGHTDVYDHTTSQSLMRHLSKDLPQVQANSAPVYNQPSNAGSEPLLLMPTINWDDDERLHGNSSKAAAHVSGGAAPMMPSVF